MAGKALLDSTLDETQRLVRASGARPWLLRRKTAGGLAFDACNGLFFIILALSFLYPFWHTIILSFSGILDVRTLGLHIWLGRWQTGAYGYILSDPLTLVGYANSIFRAVAGTTLTLVVTFLTAYPLAKRTLPGRGLVTAYILVTMFFAGGLIPTYLVIRKLGLIDSRWVLILPLLANGFYIIIMRNYLMTVDPAFEESAFMDGANYLQIMARIVAPLCKPVLATIALWTMVLHWNSWFDALIYLRDESKIVLQLLLRRLLLAEQATLDRIREFGGPIDAEDRLPSEAVKAATTLITIGPIILVYPFLQRYFIKGIFLGSLKG